MTPLAIMLVFAAFGCCWGPVRRTLAQCAGAGSYRFLLCGLVAFELLLAVRGLYTLTYLLLACGIASLTARVFKARTGRVCLHARRAFPWLLGVLAALVCVSYGRELYREHLALTRSLPAAAPARCPTCSWSCWTRFVLMP